MHFRFRALAFILILIFSIINLRAQATLILVAPPQDQTVVIGGTATLSVLAQSPNPITYQWQHNFADIPSATSATLTLTNVQLSDGGNYVVFISDGNSGAPKSAYLTVVAPPLITAQPQTATLVSGSIVHYDVQATGYNLTYQWFRDGVAIPGANDDQYIFAASAATAGTYTVTVSNLAATVTTTPAVLTVVDPVVITSQPQSQIVANNSPATFTVGVTGPGNIHYSWWGPTGGEPLWGQDGPTLAFSKVTSNNDGYYFVLISTDNQTPIQSNTVTLEVSVPPIVDRIAQQSVAVGGSPATLQAISEGYYVFTYQWKKDGIPIPANASGVSGANTGTLTISSVGANDTSKYSADVTNAFGKTTSPSYQLSYNSSDFVVTFVTNPVSVVAHPGDSVTFSAKATFGKLPPSNYHWFKDGIFVASVASTDFTLSNISASDLGNYYATAYYPATQYSSSIAVLSQTATLSFAQGAIGPAFTLQPSDVQANQNETITLEVLATGSPAPTYQWRKSGVNIPGANSATLTLANVQSSDAGAYDVIAKNAVAAVTSSVAHVSVSTPLAGPGAKLINISTRSLVGTGASVQIVGFIIQGTGPKTVLIRANGPALQKSGITTGFLADPMLELHNTDATQSIIATNDNWGDNISEKAQISSTFSTLGVSAWDDGSKDAAIVTTLNPGGYTAIVSGKNNTSGIALVEVYEIDTSNITSKLINISTRSYVGTGAEVQIAGFIISGSTPRKVIIRANGPALGRYSVSAFLADPKIDLHSATTGQPIIASNDNWDSASESEFKSAGIDNWAVGSKDAAIVTTLSPGGYTAVVSGVNGTEGIALVEVFDVSGE